MADPIERGFLRCAIKGTLYDICSDQQLRSAIVIGYTLKENTDINSIDVIVSDAVLLEDDGWAASGV